MNVKMVALFKTMTAAGVTGQMTHASYWAGALRQNEMAETFGDSEYETLAAMSLERFNADNRPDEPTTSPTKRKAKPAKEKAPPRRRPTTAAEDAAAIAALEARIDARLGPDETDRIGTLPRASLEALAASLEASPARSLARELLQRQASVSPHPRKTMTPDQKAMLERAKGSSL
jgi:hypothetical protein